MYKEEKQIQNIKDSSDVLVKMDIDESQEEVVEELKRKKMIKLPFKLDLKTVNILLIICALVSSVGYLALSNHLISQGFALNEARQKVEELTKQNRDLELTAMNLESYDNINKRIAQLNMVSASDDIEYIEFKVGGVAMR